MATAQYTYHPFHTIGAATVLIWDSQAADGNGAWQVLGRVADAAINVVTEQVGKEIVIKGLSQPIARRNRAKRYSLSFRMLENASPATLDLLFSEGAAQTRVAGGLKATSEVLRLYSEEYTELSHPYGIPETALDGVSNLQASAGGSGGSIPPGTYYYWVAPVLEDPGKPGLEGMTAASGPVAVASGEVVTITFTPPPGYQPDKYHVYYSMVSDIEGAELVSQWSAGSPITIDAHNAMGNFIGPSIPLVEVWSYDTFHHYERDSDFETMLPLGLVRRLTAGSIPEGRAILVVYAHDQRPGIETALGEVMAIEHFRKVRLLQLAPTGSDPAGWSETGLEFLFHKVNVSVNDTSFGFPEDEFGEGSPVTWDCLYDGTYGQVGTVRTSFDVLENY